MNANLRDIRKLLDRSRALSKADMDEWWTGYAFAILPIAGSWFSALAACAALWAAASLALRRFSLDLPKQALPLVLACLALGIWALFTGIYHDGLAGLWRGFLFAAPLFSLPLFIARFRASNPKRSFHAMAYYANFGLALAVLLAVVQYMLKQSVEGGAGNSYVFGFVMLALLTVSAPMADCRYLAERCLLNVLLLLLLYVADTRIHLVFLFAYACVFLFKNLKLTLASKLALTAAFTLVAGLIFKSYFSSMATEIFASDGNGLPQSFGLRVELWKAGLTIVRDVPGMGLGFESKMPEVIKLLPGHLSYIRFTHLHNMFIDAAVAMGIPALVLLSSVFIAAVYMMSALEGEIRWRGYAFLAMSVFHGSLGPLLTHDIVTAVFFVVLAIFASRLLPSTSHPD